MRYTRRSELRYAYRSVTVGSIRCPQCVARVNREVRLLSKVARRVPHVFVGYLFLLLGFVSLGALVAALAFGSDMAVVAAVVLAGSLVAAVAGFRTGAAALAELHDGDPEHNTSIWSVPLRQDQVDQYHVNFR